MFNLQPFEMFVALLVLHSLADYPLQGDFLAQGKNPNTVFGADYWPYCLSSHALIHGGAVFLITGSVWLCLAEAVIHALTDLTKCDKKINMFFDQLIHYACKAAWVAIFFTYIK